MAGANMKDSSRVAYDALIFGWAVKVPGAHDNDAFVSLLPPPSSPHHHHHQHQQQQQHHHQHRRRRRLCRCCYRFARSFT
jgi:hypothetical protein